MNDPDNLYSTVEAAIDEGRIGRPVFLRCFAHVTPDDRRLREVLADVLRMAAGWLDGSIARVFTLGGFDGGQITASLEFSEGQSALIGVSGATDGPHRLDWVLVGHRGTLCYEGEMSVQRLGPIPHLNMQPVWDALSRSLQTGEPVDVAEEDVR